MLIYEFIELGCKCQGCGRHDNYDARNPMCYVEATSKKCELCFEQEYYLELDAERDGERAI